jgi:hypothetical protein
MHTAVRVRSTVIVTLYAAGLLTGACACGGGWAPSPWSSVVTSSADDPGSDRTNSYFIFQKGVSSELFRDRELQPILQRALLEGNERKDRAAHNVAPSADAAPDTTGAYDDSTAVPEPVFDKGNLK